MRHERFHLLFETSGGKDIRILFRGASSVGTAGITTVSGCIDVESACCWMKSCGWEVRICGCAVERRKGATRASARAWGLIVDSVLVDANDDDDARPLEFTKYLK